MRLSISLRPRFSPTRWTVVALVAATAFEVALHLAGSQWGLSFGLLYTRIVQHLVVSACIGFALPLWVVSIAKREPVFSPALGLGTRHVVLAVVISVLGAVAASSNSIKEAGLPSEPRALADAVLLLLQLNRSNVPVFITVLLGSFCAIFFFLGFLRHELERAFGVAVGLAGAALGVGFWGVAVVGDSRFFIVGFVWAILVRATGSILVVFPLWIAGGAAWSTLVIPHGTRHQESFANVAGESATAWVDCMMLLFGLVAVMAVFLWVKRAHARRDDGTNLNIDRADAQTDFPNGG